ncbi:MAG: glycosyltransferase family 2 protein [Polaromonas sp.]|nr:glycosyltransferase family 2 protein [Polaromonas sp.]
MTILTIVVPTRERADTLHHTLRTLVDQDYPQLEILVSDNASVDDTAKVVASFDDSRIRYVRTPGRVGMAENWEFALDNARGQFITYIGDDDAFLPDAITKAMALLCASGLPALVWRKTEYCWPDYPVQEMQNLIIIGKRNGEARVVDAAAQLQLVMSFRDSYSTLPCLYNGIIKTELLRKVRSTSATNIFFNAVSPDVYSGIVLSLTMTSYLWTDFPFSVNGASRHSNGTSFTRSNGEDLSTPAGKFKSENTRHYDDRLQAGPSVAICVMGEYLLAQKALPKMQLPDPDFRKYVQFLLESAPRAYLPEAVASSALYTARMLRIKTQKVSAVRVKDQSMLKSYSGDGAFVAPKSIVSNVYDAAALISAMVNPSIELKKATKTGLFKHFAVAIVKNMLLETRLLLRALAGRSS